MNQSLAPVMLPSKSLPSALQSLKEEPKHDQLNPNNIQLNIRFKPGSAATQQLQLTATFVQKIDLNCAMVKLAGLEFVCFLCATFILGPEVQVGPI